MWQRAFLSTRPQLKKWDGLKLRCPYCQATTKSAVTYQRHIRMCPAKDQLYKEVRGIKFKHSLNCHRGMKQSCIA